MSTVEVLTEGVANEQLRTSIRQRIVSEIGGAQEVTFQPGRIVVTLNPKTDSGVARQQLTALLRERFSLALPTSATYDPAWD